MRNPELRVTPIPAFNDNYIWLLETGTSACAVVDPGDHRPVVKTLEERGLELDTILVTHHHADHICGVPALLERWPARVVGPDHPIGLQQAGDPLRVVLVHLTPEGVDHIRPGRHRHPTRLP